MQLVACNAFVIVVQMGNIYLEIVFIILILLFSLTFIFSLNVIKRAEGTTGRKKKRFLSTYVVVLFEWIKLHVVPATWKIPCLVQSDELQRKVISKNKITFLKLWFRLFSIPVPKSRLHFPPREHSHVKLIELPNKRDTETKVPICLLSRIYFRKFLDDYNTVKIAKAV